MAHMLRQLSGPLIKQPPSREISPERWPPALPVPLLVPAGNGPIDWLARSVLDSSTAHSGKVKRQHPVYAQPALQTVDEYVCLLDIPSLYCSTPLSTALALSQLTARTLTIAVPGLPPRLLLRPESCPTFAQSGSRQTPPCCIPTMLLILHRLPSRKVLDNIS